ncbi:Uncharacterised protein [Mycobacteroides abscessus]|nr:Uncharacterised protein [Mycobacteroides abscessus]
MAKAVGGEVLPQLFNLGNCVGVDLAVGYRYSRHFLGDVFRDNPLLTRVFEHLCHGGDHLVYRDRGPGPAFTPLGCEGAARYEIRYQSVDVGFGEPLCLSIAVTLTQRGKIVFQLRERGRPQIVASCNVIRAHLLDRDC